MEEVHEQLPYMVIRWKRFMSKMEEVHEQTSLFSFLFIFIIFIHTKSQNEQQAKELLVGGHYRVIMPSDGMSTAREKT